MVARLTGATHLVRATADNPAVDIDAAARALNLLIASGADHAIESGLPYGAAVEAMRVEALERAAELTGEPADREHVTPFIRRDNRFKAVIAPAPMHVHRPDVRFTVDTAADLAYVRRILAPFDEHAGEPSLADLIAEADRVAMKEVA
jgi:spore coat polysaccharide biosynthesis protein SpsF (cytidylyltransferase family)